MRAKNRIYHLDCFSCETCKKRLVQGDEFSVQSDGRLFCRDDSVFDDGDGDMNDNNNNNGDGDDLRGQERHVAKKEEELNEDDEDMMDMEEEEEDIEKCDNNIQGRVKAASRGMRAKDTLRPPGKDKKQLRL